jgi:hypothetical protein
VDDVESPPEAVAVFESKFSLYTLGKEGKGRSVIYNNTAVDQFDRSRFTTGSDTEGRFSPSHPGQMLKALGTGLGDGLALLRVRLGLHGGNRPPQRSLFDLVLAGHRAAAA